MNEIVIPDDEPVCVCGHYELDHHVSWFPNGYKLVEECEFYGWNEHGGGMQEEDGKWVEHCHRFRKKEDDNT